MKKISLFPLCLLLLLVSATRLSAQQKEFVQRILLDKPTDAGPLKVFPVVEDPNSYYYLPNKLRLAEDENGQPKFMFLKYVENVRSGATEKEANVGNGGGYVHLLVGLHVTDEEKKEAQQELRRTNPNGKIVGPVVYRGGTMALVTKAVITNAADGENGKSRVLGIGPAPVLEGDNIAVSFLLNKLDATLLFATLKTATPDISFNLNMMLGGYQSPVEFKIEVDWDKVYTHDIFNAGIATPILQAEIGVAVQQLKESGAIKITQIGEDPNMQKLQDVLTNKMIDMCFQPFGKEGSPNWAELGQPLNGGKSYLDRASEQLNKERDAVRTQNDKIRAENKDERRYTDEENRRRRDEEDKRNAANAGKDTSKTSGGINNGVKNTGLSSKEGPNGDNSTTSASNVLQSGMLPPSNTRSGSNNSVGPAFKNPANYKKANSPIEDLQPATATQTPQESLPVINIVASYQKKTIKHTGHYTAEAKTYFTTSLNEPFAGNIGKINCKNCILEINTDDPLYKQREVVCFIDGEISQDFDKYINYVSVSMRKKHPGGDYTTDEVRVDRKNFNSEGNSFKLMYGWMPGDNDRKTWLNYEYKTVWNFFGGGTVENDWAATNNPVVPLKAPVNRRTVNINADPDAVKANNIRSATVRIYFKIGGEEQVKQVSLNLFKQVYSASIDFILPKGQTEYEYEIEMLKGTTPVKSGRQKTSLDDIFIE
ncbi:MAG TPA: hypothetical protein VLJ68_00125 [Chitinophagaceae bacterium]|nr:hypothetical protein [Chitinophagaceae bacterium]